MLPNEISSFIKIYTSNKLSFQNPTILEEYQSSWINLFANVYTNPLPNEIKNYKGETFCIPLTLPNHKSIDIQFNIKKILKAINYFKLPIQTLSTKHFIINNSFNRKLLLQNRDLIGYALEESYDTVKEEPIVILFPTFYFINFVVDGNHRVDYAIRNNLETIDAYFLYPKYLVTNPHLFVGRISYLLFCFLEDVALLEFALHEKQQKGIFGILRTESSLLKKQSILPTVQKYIGNTYHQN